MTHCPAITDQSGPTSAWIHGEPEITELLDDPLVWLVLRRDGLTREDLRDAVAFGRARLTPRATPAIRAA